MASPMMGPPQPGQQPTPQQIQYMQQQIAQEAAKRGLTPQQYIEELKAQAIRQHQAQQQAQAQAQQQQQQQQHQQPVTPGPPKPEALAVANFLRSQELKVRTCILDEKRKDMFRVKRAIRALSSPEYEKARKKNPLLPPVTDRVSAENVFKLLPLSLLALRVSKVDPNTAHAGHNHAKPKRVKGLWTVRIEQHQLTNDDDHYVWLYEGPQWKQKLYAIGALVAVIAIVMFPLWPLFMRLGVWYLSMAALVVLGLFFAMAIVRLILFCVTVMILPRGFWLYPNLFEDVGFFDSFRPVWAWQEDPEEQKALKKAKRAEKAAKKAAKASKAPSDASGATPASARVAPGPGPAPSATTASPSPSPAPAASTAPAGAQPSISKPVTTSAAAATAPAGGDVTQRKFHQPSVEEAEEE